LVPVEVDVSVEGGTAVEVSEGVEVPVAVETPVAVEVAVGFEGLDGLLLPGHPTSQMEQSRVTPPMKIGTRFMVLLPVDQRSRLDPGVQVNSWARSLGLSSFRLQGSCSRVPIRWA
jgi:hypothetical protein